MMNDPIVEEVYQSRQKILDECHGDLKTWMERLRTAENQHRGRVVTLEAVREKRQMEERA